MKKIILAVLVLLMSAGMANAALSPQDQADVKRVEDYLNSMPTVKADFIQTTPSGATYNGVFYLKRPGRLRFEYAKPNKNFVVADGAFIHFWDDKNKDQSSAPISQTLADFLLRQQIKLSGDVTPVKVTRAAGLITIDLVETGNENVGSITLVLTDRPLGLKQWRITDPNGVTEVSLLNPQYNTDIDPGLFRFKTPGSR